MFADAYEKLDLEQTAYILDKINPLFEKTSFDPVETTIMAVDMPFYPGYRFLDINDYSVVPTRQRFVVYSEPHQVVLNFSNEPIYKLNKDVPIKLSDENVGEYVRFFFTYVRGRHGRFLISETVEDINWKEEPPPSARSAIGKMLKPVHLKRIGSDGVYHLEATMVFKDSLFKSDVDVHPHGLVNLKNEELIVEDMPVMDDILIG